MSGGSYDYVSGRIHEAAETLTRRHPSESHVLALADLMHRIGCAMAGIEWADSGDTVWRPELDDLIRRIVTPADEVAVLLPTADAAVRMLTDALDRARQPRPTNT